MKFHQAWCDDCQKHVLSPSTMLPPWERTYSAQHPGEDCPFSVATPQDSPPPTAG